MPRHNLCANPALAIDATGWGGAVAPTRTAVSGFARPNAARYTSGSFLETPRSAVVGGLSYTLRLDFRAATFNANGNTYIAWYRANGSPISFPNQAYSALAGAVTELVQTGTAPVDAASASLIADGVNYSANAVDATDMIVELAATAGGFADGDSPGWTWDGIPGASTSSESAVNPPIQPAGVPGAAVIGIPTVGRGPVTLGPAGLVSGAVGVPTVARGPVTLSPLAPVPSSAVGAPTVVRGPVVLHPTGVGPTVVVGLPLVLRRLNPAGAGPSSVVGIPTVVHGPVVLHPAGVGPTSVVGAPTINSGEQRHSVLILDLGTLRPGRWTLGKLRQG